MDENPQLIESKNDLYPYHLRIHHLPIIASFLDELTIPECIDRMLPIKGEHKISHGEALKFLIISSFTDPENNGLLLSKLYKTIKEIPSFILFNRDIRMDEFSHDVLAKSLEAVGKYGPSKFFSEIVKHIAPQLSPMLNFDSLHADILTFNVYGEKPTVGEKDPDRPLLHIAHGRPKFIGSNLKRISMGLITNSLGVPIFMKPLLGNFTTNKELNLIMREFCESIKESGNESAPPLFIPDPVFFTKINVNDFSANFIVRLPENRKEVSVLKYQDLQLESFPEDEGYSYYLTKSSFGEQKQTWLLVRSTELFEKQSASYQQEIHEEWSYAKEGLRNLATTPFFLEEDARRAGEFWISQQKRCKFESFEILTETKRLEGTERSQTGEKLQKYYFVRGTIILDNDVIDREKLGLGRFVLATNDLSLSPTQILRYYKNHAKADKSLKFIKLNEFRIPDNMLNKRERVQGLLCLTALIMLIYALLEERFQSNLKKHGATIYNHLKDPIQPIDSPTLPIIFKYLQNILGTVTYDDKNDQRYFRIHCNPNQINILKHFGQAVLDIYNGKKIEISKARFETFLNPDG